MIQQVQKTRTTVAIISTENHKDSASNKTSQLGKTMSAVRNTTHDRNSHNTIGASLDRGADIAGKLRVFAAVPSYISSVGAMTASFFTSATKIMSIPTPVSAAVSNVASRIGSAVPYSVLATTGNVLLVPESAVKMGSDITKVVAGKQQNQKIYEKQTALNKFTKHNELNKNQSYVVNSKDIQAVKELLSQQSSSHTYTMIRDSMNAASWGLASAGGISALTGIGLPVGTVLSTLSTVIGFASYLPDFMAGKSNITPEKDAPENLRQIISDYQKNLNTSPAELEKAIKNSADFINNCQRIIAENELHTIIQNVFTQNQGTNKNGAVSPTSLRQQVNDQIAGLAKNNSSLINSDLKVIREIFDKEYPKDFFAGEMNKIQTELSGKLRENMAQLGLVPPKEKLVEIEKEAIAELRLLIPKDKKIQKAFAARVFYTKTGKITKNKTNFTTNDLEQLCARSPKAKAVYEKIFTNKLLPDMKTNTTLLRQYGTENFANLVHTLMTGTVADNIPGSVA